MQLGYNRYSNVFVDMHKHMSVIVGLLALFTLAPLTHNHTNYNGYESQVRLLYIIEL